jgi:hypothetical protein
MSYFDSLSSWSNANTQIQNQQQSLEQENKDKKTNGIQEKFDAVNTKLQEGGGGLAGLGAGYQLGRKILKKARTIQQKAKEVKAKIDEVKGKIDDALGKKQPNESEPPSEHEAPPSENANTPNGMENEPQGVQATVKETDLHSATEKTQDTPDEGSAEDRLGATDEDFEQQIGSKDTKTNVGEQPTDAKAPELNEDGDTANPFKQGDRATGDAKNSKLDSIPEEQEPSFGIGGDSEIQRIVSTEESEGSNHTTQPDGTGNEGEMPTEVEGDDNLVSSLADKASSTISDIKNTVNGKINDVVNAVKGKLGQAGQAAGEGTEDAVVGAGKKIAGAVGKDALEEAGGVLDFLGPAGEIIGAGIAIGSLFHNLFDKKKEEAKEAQTQDAVGVITQSTGISTASISSANTKSNVVGGLV